MRKIRDVLRLTAAGMSKRKIAASLGIEPDGRRGLHPAGAARRPRLAAAGRPDDEALEARLYPPPASDGQGSAAAARLAGGPPRAEAAGRDAAAALGGASRRAPGRLRLQPVLRALPGLGEAAVADHAADACRRRAAVRRLRRHDAAR